MTSRMLFTGCALVSMVAQSAAASEPISTATQLQSQFLSARRQFTALADRMPAADYDFRPTPDMRTFAGGVAHVIASNFSYCANLTGQPSPHKGEDLEKTVTTKDDAVRLLKESFDFCAQYAGSMTPDKVNETYEANALGPDGQKTKIDVARGGLLSNFVAHTNEMYGYLSVYLRLKGLVPPSSDPRGGRGRGAGPGR